MSKAANEIDGQDAGKMVPAIPRQHMPLFTNFDRKWELDHLEIGHYRASIFYIQTNTLYNIEKPYFLNIPVDPEWYPTVKQTNVAYTRKSVDITDIRGHGDVFSLDIQGFALANLQTNLSYSDFTSSDTIVNRYYKEVQEFLKTFTGAAEVLPFDFQVRRKDPTLPPNSRGAPGQAQPFAAVHADQTANAAFRRLKYFHPTFAQKYANGRFQIINVWKPLKAVHDFPLAVCDYRTVAVEDLVPTDIVFPDYLGETYNFRPNPSHRWYYIDEQAADEAWMVKCFDSATNHDPNIASFTPHVSFPYSKVSTSSSGFRESIEVRTFVFYQ